MPKSRAGTGAAVGGFAGLAASSCDRVAIEEGPHTNLRRVNSVNCTTGDHQKDPQVQTAAQNEAAECHTCLARLTTGIAVWRFGRFDPAKPTRPGRVESNGYCPAVPTSGRRARPSQ